MNGQMNGQNNNMQPNNQNGFNSTTLGVSNNQNVTPNDFNMANNQGMQMNNNQTNNQVESFGMDNTNVTPVNEPVAQPIPGTEGTNNFASNGMGTNNSYTLNSGNVNTNSFVEPKKNENIGIMPPNPNNNEKKKKPMSKVLFLLIVLILIGGVAFGVYYFLSMSNKVKITPKTVTIGVGDVISDSLNDYVTVNKGDASTCSLNTTNVDSSKIGNYKVTITCGNDTYESTVVVSDLTAPEVKLVPVYKVVNETVDIKEFVEECIDPSNCTTKFVNESTVDNYLKTAGGPYKVEIEAKDSAGNAKTYTGELYVTSVKILVYLNAVSEEQTVENYQAKKTVTDIIPIGKIEGTDGLSYLNIARRNYKYVFSTKEEYEKVADKKEQTLTFDGVTGSANYDDKNMTITISSDLPLDTLKTENNGSFPTSYQEMKALYDGNGYTTSISSYENSAK